MSDQWFRSPGVAFAHATETVYVLDLRDPQVPAVPVALEGPGTSIWLSLGTSAEPRSLADIVDALAVQYAVHPEDLTADVRDFLARLEIQGFAGRIPESPGEETS